MNAVVLKGIIKPNTEYNFTSKANKRNLPTRKSDLLVQTNTTAEKY